MSYTINVKVIQSEPTAWYTIVEKTTYVDGTWSEVDGVQILTMDNSGTSGMLRFKNPQGHMLLVAVGVHNYKRWCDVVVDATISDTGVKIHPTYYDDKNTERWNMLWKQLATIERTTAKGVHIKVDYYKEDGKQLACSIRIG